MDGNKNVEKWILEDGRRAERRVTEQKNCDDGLGERVVELHVEDERPLRLQQRVVEKTKPFVYEREVQQIDPKTGEVMDKKIESIEPRVQMQVVDHITTNQVGAQSVEDDCDCHVTKEEMIETIIAAIKAERVNRPEPVQPVPPMKMAARTTNFSGRLNSLGLADEIADRVDPSGYSTWDKVLLGVIAAQIIGLGYIIFVM